MNLNQRIKNARRQETARDLHPHAKPTNLEYQLARTKTSNSKSQNTTQDQTNCNLDADALKFKNYEEQVKKTKGIAKKLANNHSFKKETD